MVVETTNAHGPLSVPPLYLLTTEQEVVDVDLDS